MLKNRTRLAAALMVSGLVATSHGGIANPVLSWTSHDTAADPSNNAIWSNPANWAESLVPTNNDMLRFPPPVAGGTRTTTNDLTNLIIDGIEVPANAYLLNGNALSLNGDVLFSAGANSTLGFGMPITLLRDVTVTNNKSTSQTPVVSFNAVVSGPFGLTIDGAGGGGRTDTNVGMTYTGDTIIRNGQLNMRLGVLYTGGTFGNVSIDASASLASNNLSATIGALNGAGSVFKAGSNSRGLTLGANDANGSHSGSIGWTGGSSSITKSGLGTQTFSGAVTVAGTSQVIGGRLNIDGSFSAGITVNAGATLGGIGSIGGAVGGAGILAPGNSIGTLTVASAAPSGTLQIEIDGTGTGSSDVLAVFGALNISNATVNFDQLTPANDTYVFATYGSLLGSSFASVIDLPAGYEIDYAFGGNRIALVAIPEPASLALLSAALLLRRRNR